MPTYNIIQDTSSYLLLLLLIDCITTTACILASSVNENGRYKRRNLKERIIVFPGTSSLDQMTHVSPRAVVMYVLVVACGLVVCAAPVGHKGVVEMTSDSIAGDVLARHYVFVHFCSLLLLSSVLLELM